MRARSAKARWVGESRSRGETRRARAGSYVEGSEIEATRRVEKGCGFPDPCRAEIIPGTCHRLLLGNILQLLRNPITHLGQRCSAVWLPYQGPPPSPQQNRYNHESVDEQDQLGDALEQVKIDMAEEASE